MLENLGVRRSLFVFRSSRAASSAPTTPTVGVVIEGLRGVAGAVSKLLALAVDHLRANGLQRQRQKHEGQFSTATCNEEASGPHASNLQMCALHFW